MLLVVQKVCSYTDRQTDRTLDYSILLVRGRNYIGLGNSHMAFKSDLATSGGLNPPTVRLVLPLKSWLLLKLQT